MNDRLPGISVLLPVFMRDVSVDNISLLRIAIQSIADQDYAGPLEILLIDDGSPVPVENFKEEIGTAASTVRWIRLKHNRGIVFALNHGIKLAQYEFIGRMDADDCWLPGKLRDQMNLFADDGDLSIVATGMSRVDNKGRLIDTHIRPGNWNGILSFFVEGGCPFPHGSVVARRQIYELLGGYSHSADVQHCEDYALWGIWLRFFKPAMVEKALYQYRVSSSSVSSQYESAQVTASRLVRQRFASLQLTNDLPNALRMLADVLGCSLIEAGKIAYTMWQYGACLALPESSRDPLSVILPDRLICRDEPAMNWRSIIRSAPSETEGELIGLVARPY